MNPDRDLAHTVGNARKRILEQQPNHDEVHAHEDVDWHLMRGED